MKKQYMQPKFQMTMFAEDAIRTSITFTYDGEGFLESSKFESWF